MHVCMMAHICLNSGSKHMCRHWHHYGVITLQSKVLFIQFHIFGSGCIWISVENICCAVSQNFYGFILECMNVDCFCSTFTRAVKNISFWYRMESTKRNSLEYNKRWISVKCSLNKPLCRKRKASSVWALGLQGDHQ